MIRPVSLIISCSIVLLMMSGCAGYRLGDVKPSAFQGINNLYVPIFRNDTLEPRLSSLVTNAVLKELHVDGTYKITNKANADAILVGRIVTIRKRQLRSALEDTLETQELRVDLEIQFHLRDPVTGKIITRTTSQESAEVGEEKVIDSSGETTTVRQGRVIGRTIQFVEENFQVAERAAYSVAAQDAAKKLVSRIANGF